MPEKKQRYFEWALDNKELFWGGVNVFSESQKKQILNNTSDYDTYYQFVDPQYKNFYKKNNNSDFINKMTYLDLKHRLPELLLMRVDKMAMASSVETRVPYLDHKLVEFALQIPSSLKYKNNTTKYILKEAARGIIPDDVIERKKTGFCGSATNMVSGHLLSYAKDEINNSQWMNEYFVMNEINQIIDDHSKAKKDYSMQIFNLLNLSLWHKEWF